MASYKDKKEDFENFRKRYEKEIKTIPIKDFDELFYAKGYFIVNRTPYDDERFYEVLYEISSNIIKARLQELEYYINLKPQTPAMQIETETITKEMNKIEHLYFKFHIHYKKMHQMGIEQKSQTKETIQYLESIYDDIKNFQTISSKLQNKFIKNFENHLKEIETQKVKKYESSIYN
jgi:hypothetical protein